MASWPSLSFPSAKSADRIFLILNLVPLAISAGIRALFWYFEIPLLFMDGWAVKRKDVAWEHENSRIRFKNKRSLQMNKSIESLFLKYVSNTLFIGDIDFNKRIVLLILNTFKVLDAPRIPYGIKVENYIFFILI
jgi:hypothetical protein